MPITHRVILQHHEDLGGSGYPEGRSGESINTFARATRIVDTYDALTSLRPYCAPLKPYEALTVMANEMRSKLDMPMLRRFIRHVADGREEGPFVVRTDVAVAEGQPEEGEVAAPEQMEPSVEAASRADVLGAPDSSSVFEAPAIRLEEPTPADAPAPKEDGEPAGQDEAIPVVQPVLAEPVEAELPVVGPIAAEPVEAEPAVEEPLRAVRDLVEKRDGEVALMRGIMGALRTAITDGPLRRDDPSSPEHIDSDGATARSLAPLVQQMDDARAQLAASAPSEPEARRRHADALDALDAVRAGLLRLAGRPKTGAGGQEPEDSARADRRRQMSEEPEVAEREPIRFRPERRKAG
jgi:hypothetical protein